MRSKLWKQKLTQIFLTLRFYVPRGNREINRIKDCGVRLCIDKVIGDIVDKLVKITFHRLFSPSSNYYAFFGFSNNRFDIDIGKDIGEVNAIDIAHDNSGGSPGWLIMKVSLEFAYFQ